MTGYGRRPRLGNCWRLGQCTSRGQEVSMWDMRGMGVVRTPAQRPCRGCVLLVANGGGWVWPPPAAVQLRLPHKIEHSAYVLARYQAEKTLLHSTPIHQRLNFTTTLLFNISQFSITLSIDTTSEFPFILHSPTKIAANCSNQPEVIMPYKVWPNSIPRGT